MLQFYDVFSFYHKAYRVFFCLKNIFINLFINEVNFKTHRQNIIDGWKRETFIYTKIGLILCMTLVTGWVRDVLIVPAVWLAGFVWETRLILEASGPTRFLLLGAILIVVMVARPQGLLGKPRVEIV